MVTLPAATTTPTVLLLTNVLTLQNAVRKSRQVLRVARLERLALALAHAHSPRVVAFAAALASHSGSGGGVRGGGEGRGGAGGGKRRVRRGGGVAGGGGRLGGGGGSVVVRARPVVLRCVEDVLRQQLSALAGLLVRQALQVGDWSMLFALKRALGRWASLQFLLL